MQEPAQRTEQNLKREKILGYILRIIALLIWGTDPIIAKYFLKDYNGLFVASFSIYVGAIFLFPIAVILFWKRRKDPNRLQPRGYNRYFFAMVLFGGLVSIFHFLSVNYTIASNAVLFLNFAPVIALVFSLLWYREKFHYLLKASKAIKVLLVFLIGGIGSSLLIINTPTQPNVDYSHKLLGDFLAFVAVILDIFSTMAQIHYTKQKEAFSGLDYTIRRVFLLMVLYAPYVLPKLFTLELSKKEWLGFIFIGCFTTVLAYYFSFEAYKRLDGLVVYFLFIITPLFTIALETILFGLKPSLQFFVGGLLILSAAISVEFITRTAKAAVVEDE